MISSKSLRDFMPINGYLQVSFENRSLHYKAYHFHNDLVQNCLTAGGGPVTLLFNTNNSDGTSRLLGVFREPPDGARRYPWLPKSIPDRLPAETTSGLLVLKVGRVRPLARW
jgi:hypothetical protein